MDSTPEKRESGPEESGQAIPPLGVAGALRTVRAQAIGAMQANHARALLLEAHGKGGITDEQMREFLECLGRLPEESWKDVNFFKGKGRGRAKAFYVPRLKSLPLFPDMTKEDFMHEMNHHLWYEKMSVSQRQTVTDFHNGLTREEIQSTQYRVHPYSYDQAHEWLAQTFTTWFHGLPASQRLRLPKFALIVSLFKSLLHEEKVNFQAGES
ncbi:MAG: hypothetical protein Greene041619_157 [Candidatus Peregrinibacteria bacterium Greene0416_19]|nr:MAG: hypothetical protein Greene041619_157 [Candidatus Peregrinibacteria bacterium Greene0416_19]